jgi:DNA-binding response OmpR family regulator
LAAASSKPVGADRAGPAQRETEHLGIPLVLLLTEDRQLEATLSEALSQSHFLVARDPNAALRMICERGRDLSLLLIDFDHAAVGLTLLSTIRSLFRKLPIVAFSAEDNYHATALAYSSGVAAALAKPISAEELKDVLGGLFQPKLALGAA